MNGHHIQREFEKPFSSWKQGEAPDGYYERPLGTHGREFFQENGFVVVRDVLNTSEVFELREETSRLCREDGNRLAHAVEDLTSLKEEDLLTRFLCIHFPHKISERMRRVVSQDVLVETLTQLIGPNVKCMQSMLFIKAAGKPGQAWHQDELFIPTRDRSLVGAWIALDDATVENGCLWVIPGSHKPGILWPNKDHGDYEQFDCAKESFAFPYSEADEVPVEVKAGSAVFFNGYLLHRSLPNWAPHGFRRSLVNHYMSAESTLPWLKNEGYEGDWLGQQDFRDIILVAGEDPYAWKGVEDRSRAHCRKSGEGGCGDASQNLKPTREP